MKLSANNINLGNLKIGNPKMFSVRIINTRNEAITITKVRVGCGKCTRANVGQLEIPAQGSTSLNITFTPDSTSRVPVTKTVTITDNNNETIIFSFNATVSH